MPDTHYRRIDKGMTGPVKWTDPDFIPENWHKFWMPGYWADQGVKGSSWYYLFQKGNRCSGIHDRYAG